MGTATEELGCWWKFWSDIRVREATWRPKLFFGSSPVIFPYVFLWGYMIYYVYPSTCSYILYIYIFTHNNKDIRDPITMFLGEVVTHTTTAFLLRLKQMLKEEESLSLGDVAPARWNSRTFSGSGGFHKWWYPNSWTVYFMEVPNQKNGWFGGTPWIGNLQVGDDGG